MLSNSSNNDQFLKSSGNPALNLLVDINCKGKIVIYLQEQIYLLTSTFEHWSTAPRTVADLEIAGGGDFSSQNNRPRRRTP